VAEDEDEEEEEVLEEEEEGMRASSRMPDVAMRRPRRVARLRSLSGRTERVTAYPHEMTRRRERRRACDKEKRDDEEEGEEEGL
jgi:hypothetical protein